MGSFFGLDRRAYLVPAGIRYPNTLRGDQHLKSREAEDSKELDFRQCASSADACCRLLSGSKHQDRSRRAFICVRQVRRSSVLVDGYLDKCYDLGVVCDGLEIA